MVCPIHFQRLVRLTYTLLMSFQFESLVVFFAFLRKRESLIHRTGGFYLHFFVSVPTSSSASLPGTLVNDRKFSVRAVPAPLGLSLKFHFSQDFSHWLIHIPKSINSFTLSVLFACSYVLWKYIELYMINVCALDGRTVLRVHCFTRFSWGFSVLCLLVSEGHCTRSLFISCTLDYRRDHVVSYIFATYFHFEKR